MTGIKPQKPSNPKLHGGIAFTKATTPPITKLPAPAILAIKLVQHQGLAGKVIVNTGEHVLQGQPLTHSDHLTGVPVHASRSGIVTEISQSHITIQTSCDKNSKGVISQSRSLTRDQLAQQLHQNGLVGLGGASFPVAQKINQLQDEATTLLINAAECDPLIHCDNALMCANANEIVAGIKIIAESCSIDQVVIGVEDNKPTAIKSITSANTQAGLNAKIVEVPSVYPSGAEKLLLALCSINNSPSPYPLANRGILCFNIATCYAVYNAVTRGMPLISRVTTVVDTKGNIHNFEISVGTPLADIYKAVHLTDTLPNESSIGISIGGKMMGKPASITDSITKSTNCIAFNTIEENSKQSTACIRCGACADICPEHLLPQQLYSFALNFNESALVKHQLSHCIECACCDMVCPSHLPLTQYFNSAKQRIAEQEFALHQAETARQRFEKREHRLAASSHPHARRAVTNQQTKSLTDDTPAIATPVDSKKALIEAALQRKKNRSNPTRAGDHGSKT